MKTETPICPNCGSNVRPGTPEGVWSCSTCEAFGTMTSLWDHTVRVVDTTTHYFTFGQAHLLPNGLPAKDEYVVVVAPEGVDHRTMFMAWLGSNVWAGEYTYTDWHNSRSCEMYYEGKRPYATIVITERY